MDGLENETVPVVSDFKLISNGLLLIVLRPEITLKSLFNVSKFNPYTALPTHLYSWNNGLPPAVCKFSKLLPPLLTNLPVAVGS